MIVFRLHEELRRRRLTRYWLAKQSGVRYATIWKLYRGEVGMLNLQVLDRVCAALECEPGDLLRRVPGMGKKRKER